MSCGAKGRVVSAETRRKQSLRNKLRGIKPPKFTELSPTKQKEVLRKKALKPSKLKGRILSEEHRAKLRGRKGERSPTWKGGVSYAKNYKRLKKMEYLGRKWTAEGSHTKGEWEGLKEKYGFMCLCCKRVEPEIKLTEDHIVPLSKGGSDNISNIQPLCSVCNSSKNVKVINYVALLV